jgi:hypothetical protein
MSIEDDARRFEILNNRKVKLSEIVETVKISKKRVEHIVH